MGYIDILYTIKVSYGFEQFLVSLSNFTKRGIYILNGVEVDGITEGELKSYLKLFKSMEPRMISYILSSLKSMNMGDIEANFMFFCYYDFSSSGGSGNSSSTEIVDSQQAERKFRNSNLERIESAKLSKGSESLVGEMSPVGFAELSEFFDLEKVSE